MSLRARWRSRRERRFQRRTAGDKTTGHELLRAFAGAHPDPFFIEIGAGDGVAFDHLWPFAGARGWPGIMVEPVPYVFDQLCRNYASLDRVVLENVAISDHDGTLPFHYLAEATGRDRERLPDAYHLLGSLSRDRLLRYEHIPDLKRRIVSEEVPCMAFDSLVRKHAVKRLDVLVVDAEGYDCEILGQLDFDVIRPRVLVYEDIHVSPAEGAACRERLHRLDYETMEDAFDTWCLDVRPGDSLVETWRRLREVGPTVSREDVQRWYAAAGRGRGDPPR